MLTQDTTTKGVLHMSARLHRLTPKPARLRSEQAAKVRQAVLELDFDPEAIRPVLLSIDRNTAASRGWTFVMLSPSQNAAVVGWLRHHSKRPGVAIHLWAELLTGLRIDTGQVLLTRTQLAERVGVPPRSVSEILTELEDIGAISRRRQPTPGVRGKGSLEIFINPNVATHLTGTARDTAQAEAKPVEAQTTPKPVTARKRTERNNIRVLDNA